MPVVNSLPHSIFFGLLENGTLKEGKEGRGRYTQRGGATVEGRHRREESGKIYISSGIFFLTLFLDIFV